MPEPDGVRGETGTFIAERFTSRWKRFLDDTLVGSCSVSDMRSFAIASDSAALLADPVSRLAAFFAGWLLGDLERWLDGSMRTMAAAGSVSMLVGVRLRRDRDGLRVSVCSSRRLRTAGLLDLASGCVSCPDRTLPGGSASGSRRGPERRHARAERVRVPSAYGADWAPLLIPLECDSGLGLGSVSSPELD